MRSRSLMVTDPPYGVELRSGVATPSRRQHRTRRTGKVANDDRADWRAAWALFPGDVAYVWHAALHAGAVADSLAALRLSRSGAADHLGQGPASSSAAATIIGNTNRVGTRCGATGTGRGDRKQTTLWQIPSRAQDADTVHGTQKPVECMRRPIENNSSPGQAVYEPFAGSGTTIIAAEMTGRVCHAIELNPVYVDVAVRRWQAFTGKTATWRRTASASPRSRRSAVLPARRSRMAQRGRKPKPVAAKIAAGNPGKRPLATLVPAPAAGDMICPQAVQRNARASRVLEHVSGQCGAEPSVADRRAVARATLCMALAYADEANDKIEELGLLVKAPNTGLPIQSPYLPVLNRQTELARKLAAELALPPAQRNRVGPYGPEHDGPSPWDALEG